MKAGIERGRISRNASMSLKHRSVCIRIEDINYTIMSEQQECLIAKKNILWQIVKIFHPNAPETFEYSTGSGEVKHETHSISYYTCDNLIVIAGHLRGYGRVDIGINNMAHSLEGPSVTLERVKEEIRKHKVYVDDSRRIDDKFYQEEIKNKERLNEELNMEKDAAALLRREGFDIASAEEIFAYYYSDH